MRSINTYTLTEYDFICILNRNMRFCFSQYIAVWGWEVGSGTSIRLSAIQRMFEKEKALQRLSQSSRFGRLGKSSRDNEKD